MLENIKEGKQELLKLSKKSSPLISPKSYDPDRLTDYPRAQSPTRLQSPNEGRHSPAFGSRRSSLSLSAMSESSLTSDNSSLLSYNANRMPRKKILKNPHRKKKISKNRVRFKDEESDTMSMRSFDSVSTASEVYNRARNGVMEVRQNLKEFERSPTHGSVGLTPVRGSRNHHLHHHIGGGPPQHSHSSSSLLSPSLTPHPSNSPSHFLLGGSPGGGAKSMHQRSVSASSLPQAPTNKELVNFANSNQLPRTFQRSPSPLASSAMLSPSSSISPQRTLQSTPKAHYQSDSFLMGVAARSPTGDDSRALSPSQHFDIDMPYPVLKLDNSNLTDLEESTAEDRKRMHIFKFPQDTPITEAPKGNSGVRQSPKMTPVLLDDDDEGDYDHLSPKEEANKSIDESESNGLKDASGEGSGRIKDSSRGRQGQDLYADKDIEDALGALERELEISSVKDGSSSSEDPPTPPPRNRNRQAKEEAASSDKELENGADMSLSMFEDVEELNWQVSQASPSNSSLSGSQEMPAKTPVETNLWKTTAIVGNQDKVKGSKEVAGTNLWKTAATVSNLDEVSVSQKVPAKAPVDTDLCKTAATVGNKDKVTAPSNGLEGPVRREAGVERHQTTFPTGNTGPQSVTARERAGSASEYDSLINKVGAVNGTEHFEKREDQRLPSKPKPPPVAPKPMRSRSSSDAITGSNATASSPSPQPSHTASALSTRASSKGGVKEMSRGSQDQTTTLTPPEHAEALSSSSQEAKALPQEANNPSPLDEVKQMKFLPAQPIPRPNSEDTVPPPLPPKTKHIRRKDRDVNGVPLPPMLDLTSSQPNGNNVADENPAQAVEDILPPPPEFAFPSPSEFSNPNEPLGSYEGLESTSGSTLVADREDPLEGTQALELDQCFERDTCSSSSSSPSMSHRSNKHSWSVIHHNKTKERSASRAGGSVSPSGSSSVGSSQEDATEVGGQGRGFTTTSRTSKSRHQDSEVFSHFMNGGGPTVSASSIRTSSSAVGKHRRGMETAVLERNSHHSSQRKPPDNPYHDDRGPNIGHHHDPLTNGSSRPDSRHQQANERVSNPLQLRRVPNRPAPAPPVPSQVTSKLSSEEKQMLHLVYPGKPRMMKPVVHDTGKHIKEMLAELDNESISTKQKPTSYGKPTE